MRSFPKQLAASAVLLGLLAAGAALPATAASPLSAAAAITMPWATVAVESIAPGDYAATMTVGTAQQLSPDILPEKAARRANVSFVSDNPNIVSVTSDGVAQARWPWHRSRCRHGRRPELPVHHYHRAGRLHGGDGNGHHAGVQHHHGG